MTSHRCRRRRECRVSRRVGLQSMGPHRLRHGTATQLVRCGASWPEIAQVLRHRDMAVTVVLCHRRLRPDARAGTALAWCAMTDPRAAVDSYLALRRGLGFNSSTQGGCCLTSSTICIATVPSM